MASGFGRPIRLAALAAALACIAPAVACQKQDQPAEYASSANLPSYAEDYPNVLHRARKSFQDDEREATRLIDELATYPEPLSETNWKVVREVWARADSAGRSAMYARARRDADAAARFFEEEEQALSKKVGGSVQWAAKQKGCSAELASPAINGMKKGVEEQLDERLEENNAATLYVDQNRDVVGKKNVEKLKEQAGDLAHASYLTFVAVPRATRELQRVAAEGETVKSTLDGAITEAEAVAKDESRDKAVRDEASERASKMRKARGLVDTQVQQANALLEQTEQRTGELQKKYRDALDKLLKAADANASGGG